MSMLSELVDFIKTRSPFGASFSEIREYLEIEDKEEAKNLIKDAYNKKLIKTIGEKRGTKYIISDNENSEIQEESNELSSTIDVYLKSSTPYHDLVLTEVEKIIKFKEPKNLLEFVQNGIVLKTTIIEYDYINKKNKIEQTNIIKRMNYFTIKIENKIPTIKKFDVLNNKESLQSFSDYYELREELKTTLKG